MLQNYANAKKFSTRIDGDMNLNKSITEDGQY
jgi:hypothetical protein